MLTCNHCPDNSWATPERKGLCFNRWPTLDSHQTFYGSLHGILALRENMRGNMVTLPGSSSENGTRFDRALNLINRADFFAVFLNDVKKIYVTN